MPEYLTPGVYYQLVDKAPPVIRRVRTDIAGFVGLAERGPLDELVQIESWRQFQVVFGSFVPYSYLAYTVKGFFENGGRTCFVVRIAGNQAEKASLTLKNKLKQDVIKISAINEGAWGKRIAVTLTQIRPGSLEFTLIVKRDKRDIESFHDLSIKPEGTRYFINIINKGDGRKASSQWISVEDLTPIGIPRTFDYLPDPDESGLKNGTGSLEKGKDGVASLTISDFLGNSDVLASEKEKKGLSAFDRVDAVGIICIPDIHIQPVILAPEVPPPEEPPSDPCIQKEPSIPGAIPRGPIALEQPPRFSENDILSVQRAMIEHCEQQKDRVAILDAPIKTGSGKPFTLTEINGWRKKFDSDRGFGALYYPWIKAVDPLHINRSPVRAIPPCGHIAGLYARIDSSIGVHKAPANEELFWAEDVTVQINDAEQGVLNPEGINCLRAFAGRGIRVYGARTISSNPDWRYINVRRLMMMIEEAVDESMQWAVFEPNDYNLRQLLIAGVSSFLETIWRQGALVGATADEAFIVTCDETNNPPDVVDQGKIIVDVGVAPTIPAEFIVFRVGRTLEEFEIVER